VSCGYDEAKEQDGGDFVPEIELVELNGSNSRRVEVLKVALLAGLVGLQVCLPVLAESLGLEVARSSDATAIVTDLSDFQNGFSGAFLLIFFSEIGDKTFFIAALLATRKSNLAVFTGTFGALAAMTVISVTLGRAFHYLDNLIPNMGAGKLPLDDLAAVVLLVYFGVSTLVDAASMEGSKAEEEKQDAELAIAGVSGDGSLGFQAAATTVASTFALVFVAEWGDKSFFSTIALAAASSPAGVVTGAIAGHGVATVLAVLGGSFLSEYVSEKLIAYVGGILFLVFAASTLVDILK
jgi:putative Ca2+/H+ antiporter (TMEM165/GDT1 family)